MQPSGWRMGRAFILEDITQARQAQHELAQLKWAQATLEERELLGDELHDNFSQNLAFINLQAQTAQLYIQSQQEELARASIFRLAEATGQIQEDTREMIDHLLSVSKPSKNFCTTLHQMLSSFQTQTDWQPSCIMKGWLPGKNATIRPGCRPRWWSSLSASHRRLWQTCASMPTAAAR